MKSTMYYNYEFRGKAFGIIDYKSLVIVFLTLFVILSVTNILNVPYKITFIVICAFSPIAAIIIFCGNENESSIDIISNVAKFYIKSGIYCPEYKNIKCERLEKGGIYQKVPKQNSKNV